MLAPINPKQRIIVIDMNRGFVFFGVLFASMFDFGGRSMIWTVPSDRIVKVLMVKMTDRMHLKYKRLRETKMHI